MRYQNVSEQRAKLTSENPAAEENHYPNDGY